MWYSAYSFLEVFGYVGIGAYLSVLYHILSVTEPFSYYLIGGIGKYYKIHRNINTRYSDVIGCDELKKEITDTITLFQQTIDCNIYTLMFKGNSGTGKTFMATAIAGECGIPFIEILANEMNKQYLPTVVNSVLKKHSPCIIFIDECHGIMTYSQEYMLRTLDSMSGNKNKVIFIFATNKSDTIDPALLRSGRIDKIINFDNPNKDERQIHLKLAFPLLDSKQCEEIANKMGSVTQAQVNFLKREYNFLQRRHKLNNVTVSDPMVDIYNLIEKLQLGYHTQQQVMSDDDKYRIAIHEIGHAFTAFILRLPSLPNNTSSSLVCSSTSNLNSNSISISNSRSGMNMGFAKPTKVSINGVGAYAGYNIINFDDTNIHTKHQLWITLAILYAGHIAEKYFFEGNTSTLITSDMIMIKSVYDRMSDANMFDKPHNTKRNNKRTSQHNNSSNSSDDSNSSSDGDGDDGNTNNNRKEDGINIYSSYDELSIPVLNIPSPKNISKQRRGGSSSSRLRRLPISGYDKNMAKLEKFLVNKVFKPYELDIKALTNTLITEGGCFEGQKLTTLFESYNDKVVIDIK